MVDPDNVRSLDWPRAALAVVAILAVSVAVGEMLLLIGRVTIRSVRAAADRFRGR